jgi:hypothetical protein
VVTQIGSDGTIERRMVDTAGRGDAFQWEDLITRALAVPLPYRPAPGGAVYHLRVDDWDVMVAEHDLAGPLLGLVTAVLAEGEAPSGFAVRSRRGECQVTVNRIVGDRWDKHDPVHNSGLLVAEEREVQAFREVLRPWLSLPGPRGGAPDRPAWVRAAGRRSGGVRSDTGLPGGRAPLGRRRRCRAAWLLVRGGAVDCVVLLRWERAGQRGSGCD